MSIYQNDAKFKQSTSGFGFSNFRTPSNTLIEAPERCPEKYLDSRHQKFFFQNHSKDYQLFENNESNDNYLDIMKNFQEKNPLIEFFFSKKNLDHLQELIMQMVKHKCGHQISRQSDRELLTIMRSIYINTTLNPLSNGVEFQNEICKLNKNVIDSAVPIILNKIMQYINYINGFNHMPIPGISAKNSKNTGLKIARGFDHFI